MATALVAADFNVTTVPLDPHGNVIVGWGTITGNDDYATGTWVISPSFLGLKSIGAVVVCNLLADSTATTPVENVVGLKDNADGTFTLELNEDWAGTANSDADGFDGVTFSIFFIGSGTPVAPA